MTNRRWQCVILAILIVALYATGLGVSSLWDIDEGIYADIAREMTIRHDYLTPYFNYEPRFDKPPLIYWVTAGFYNLFGVNEITTRLGSAIFALLTIFLLGLGAKRILSMEGGEYIAAVLATSLGLFLQARIGLTDTALTFFLTVSLMAFYQGWRGNDRRFYLMSGAAVGLGILTKGPVALILFGLVVLFFLGRHLLREFSSPYTWLALAIAILIAAPWHIIMTFRHGGAFWSSYFGYHMFTRFTTGIESHGFPWYYYLPVLFFTFLPWIPFALPALLRVRRIDRREPERFLAVWFLTIFLFFSIARTKLPGYILPVLPALAALVGSYLSGLHGQSSRVAARVRVLAVAGLSCMALLLLLGLLLIKPQVPVEYQQVYVLLFFFPAVTCLGAILLYVTGRGCAATARGIASVIAGVFYVCLLVFTFTVAPAMEADKPIKPLALAAREGGTVFKIASYLREDASAVFYTGGKVIFLNDDSQLKALLTGRQRVRALVYPYQLQRIGLADRVSVIARHGQALLVQTN